jgi:Spy/CpxP family protein refolding chaperone
MKKLFIIIAVLIVSATFVLPTYAVQPDKKPGSHKEFCFKKHLNLSDQQLAKMKELKDHFRNDTRDLRYDLAIKRIETRKLFTDPKTDDATLLAKQKEISDLRQQLSEKKAQMKIEWRKILTPEQIAKLDRLPHRHHAKEWAHHRHHDRQYPAKKDMKSAPSRPRS